MSKEKRDVRKQFLLDETTATDLKKASELKNMSENEIVYRAIQAYLKRFSFPTDNTADDIIKGDQL